MRIVLPVRLVAPQYPSIARVIVPSAQAPGAELFGGSKLTLKEAFRTSPPDVAKRPVHVVDVVDPIWRVAVIVKVDLIANECRLFGSYCIGANQGFQQLWDFELPSLLP